MKKFFLSVMLMVMAITVSAMSDSRLRSAARFLSDRMAYELDLTPMQYDDCFEINYDFFVAANGVMDDVVDGYLDAVNTYYDYLDYRNEDIRQVLDAAQYARFLEADYFYSPIYTRRGGWYFRIYNVYNNPSFFYYDRPTGFYTYRGAHSRRAYSLGFYAGRYSGAPRYGSPFLIRQGRGFDMRRRQDFGANLRRRDAPRRYNNYRNPDQRNRAADPRYRSERPNVNAPRINERNRPDNAPGPSQSAPDQGRGRQPQSSRPAQTSPNRESGRQQPATSRSNPSSSKSAPANTKSTPAPKSGGGGVSRSGRR